MTIILSACPDVVNPKDVLTSSNAMTSVLRTVIVHKLLVAALKDTVPMK